MPNPFRKIRIMISSRNRDLIPAGKRAVPLEEIRTAIQNELSKEKLCGHELLDVWINEAAGAADATGDAWQKCMDEVDAADLVIVIYNGHAGWTLRPGGVGICHAEFHHALSFYRSKLRLICLEFKSNRRLRLFSPDDVSQQTDINKRYGEELETANIFRDKATNAETLKRAVRLAVVKGVAELMESASRTGRRGRSEVGSLLKWSRLDYTRRSQEIVKTVGEFFQALRKAARDRGFVILDLSDTGVLLQPHGIPSGFGVAEARERVGRPYLHDYKQHAAMEELGLVGPIHILACHKKCTETQVTKFMGHPDLFMVQTAFGFFVADQTSFVQAFFLLDCRDEISTRVACQRLLDWINQSGEARRIVERATSRKRIISAVANEMASSAT
jgi:hypothetical protein